MSAGQGYIPFTLLALVVLAFWAVITGGRHEDGVAGAVDPARGGTHGTLAVLMLVLIRWQALSSLTLDPVPALAAALGLGQAAVVALAWCASPAGSGSAPRLSDTLSTWIALAAIALGMALAFWPGARVASFLLGGTPAIVLLARVYFTQRFGGVTSECLGATGQLAETWCLVVYTCRPCTL